MEVLRDLWPMEGSQRRGRKGERGMVVGGMEGKIEGDRRGREEGERE